jgi:hypothetical protein
MHEQRQVNNLKISKYYTLITQKRLTCVTALSCGLVEWSNSLVFTQDSYGGENIGHIFI